jgi:PPOX class probable F420-dependent enzyme
MPAELTEAARKLLGGPNLCYFVTLMKDGSPQVTPVWVDFEGDHVLVNTAEGRQKMRNLRRDSRVALCVVDPNRSLSYVQVRGRVVEMITGEPAWAHIEKLAEKYMGRRSYPRRPGEARVLLKIEPDYVTTTAL